MIANIVIHIHVQYPQFIYRIWLPVHLISTIWHSLEAKVLFGVMFKNDKFAGYCFFSLHVLDRPARNNVIIFVVVVVT